MGCYMEVIKEITKDQVETVIELSSSGLKYKLVEYVESLPDLVKAELAFLSWKGRGDDIADEPSEIDAILDEVQDQTFVSYLVNSPLHMYLSKTLRLGYL